MTMVATPRVFRATSCATLRARHLDGGASWVLELSGEADVATLAMLREELEQVVAMNREHVVVDVTKLAFCDVHSAHLILTARRTNPVTVRGATGPVERVFDLLDALQRVPRTRVVTHLFDEPFRGPRIPGGLP